MQALLKVLSNNLLVTLVRFYLVKTAYESFCRIYIRRRRVDAEVDLVYFDCLLLAPVLHLDSRLKD